MTPLIISIAAFFGVAALVAGVAIMFRGNSESTIEDRLTMLTGSNSAKQLKEGLLKQSVLAQPLETGQSILEVIVARFSKISLSKFFEQADTALTASRFLLITLVLGGLGALLPPLVHWPLYLAPVIGGTLAVMPFIYLWMRRKMRFKKFAKQLPDALELMSRALRAGHSLGSGMNLVAGEMTAPIGREFGRVFEEQNLGIPLDEALDNMTNRIPNLDLRFFATAVVLQKQTGGDLAEILDKIGYIVRERFKIFGQVQALTGEGRLSGIVLLALPPALFLAVYRLNPDYVMPLFTDPLGRKMLAGGIVMQLLGAVVIKKIINIKV